MSKNQCLKLRNKRLSDNPQNLQFHQMNGQSNSSNKINIIAGEYTGSQNQSSSVAKSNMVNATTNDNIIKFQNSQRIAMASKLVAGSPNLHNSETKTLNNSKLNRFIKVQDLIEEENDEVRTDQSEYDKSVSIRKGRFNVMTNQNFYKNYEEFKGFNIESNSGTVGYLRPVSQLENRTQNDYNFNYNYNMMPMQTRQSMTEYSLKERSETGTTRNLYPFITEFNQPSLRDENGFYRPKNEMINTPIFTNTNVDPQVYYQNRLPSLFIESRSNREVDNERLEEQEKSSVYTNIEDKGSPWNSSYYNHSKHLGSAHPDQYYQNKSEARSQTNRNNEYDNKNFENSRLAEQNMPRDVGIQYPMYYPQGKLFLLLFRLSHRL